MSFPSFEDFDECDDFDEDEEESFAELTCGMGPDGYCGHAGSEHCEFECPYRDA